ncbi:nuclear transport factor 2 family protein [Amycolatopsis sp. NPDC051371]|uniref:nuclear transport factor 2 family protein n=1 Tax=Amycolatopsis sp. NPDC051371 TaxID=3155800 RepID=UPI003446DBDC
MPEAPFLTKWFEIMDSDAPSRILDLITDDFTFSILFSTDGRATDFAGGREAMEGYLAQREKNTLTHHPLDVSSTGHGEFYLGEVRRAGEVVATFVAAGQVGASGRLERLIIGRSPGVRFEGGADVQPGAAGR